MKKIFLSLALVLLAAVQSVQAVTQVFTVSAGTAWNATNFFSVGSRINSITINTGSSGGATNLSFALVDFPGVDVTEGWGATKHTNASYTVSYSYLTNITKVTTNFSGALITNTVANALYSYQATVGQTSNDWRRIAVDTVGSNSAVSITGPFPVVYGLGLTNNNIGTAISVTVNHDPNL